LDNFEKANKTLNAIANSLESLVAILVGQLGLLPAFYLFSLFSAK
jgi:hypothetical protein